MNKDLEKLGFKIYSSNSSLDKAKVILLGEAHDIHDKEISDFIFEYFQKKDVLLIEGADKGKKINDLFDPKEKIKVYGADDVAIGTECAQYVRALQELDKSLGDSKLTDSQEENLRYLVNKLFTLQKRRDDVFFDAICEAVQKHKKSQIYFTVGLEHITDDYLCSKLAEEKIKYCALVPLKNPLVSKEERLLFIDKLKKSYLSDLDKE